MKTTTCSKSLKKLSNRPSRLNALLDLRDGLPRVEPLRTHFSAVHDGTAPVELKGVVERGEALGGVAVARVDDPPCSFFGRVGVKR